MTDSRPILAWEDELEPFRRLAGSIAVRARDLYLAADPSVAARSRVHDREYMVGAVGLAYEQPAGRATQEG